MRAQYPGHCSICEKAIRPGQEILVANVRLGGSFFDRWVHAEHIGQQHKNQVIKKARTRSVEKRPVLVANGRVYHRARHENSRNSVVYTLCNKLGRVDYKRSAESLEKIEGMHLCAECSRRSN